MVPSPPDCCPHTLHHVPSVVVVVAAAGTVDAGMECSEDRTGEQAVARDTEEPSVGEAEAGMEQEVDMRVKEVLKPDTPEPSVQLTGSCCSASSASSADDVVVRVQMFHIQSLRYHRIHRLLDHLRSRRDFRTNFRVAFRTIDSRRKKRLAPGIRCYCSRMRTACCTSCPATRNWTQDMPPAGCTVAAVAAAGLQEQQDNSARCNWPVVVTADPLHRSSEPEAVVAAVGAGVCRMAEAVAGGQKVGSSPVP